MREFRTLKFDPEILKKFFTPGEHHYMVTEGGIEEDESFHYIRIREDMPIIDFRLVKGEGDGSAEGRDIPIIFKTVERRSDD